MAEVSRAYGDKFIKYQSPGRQFPPGVWTSRDFQDYWEPTVLELEEYAVTFLSTPAVSAVSYEVHRGGWPKDSFTQIELLDNEEDYVQDLIFRIRSSHPVQCREILANRLVELLHDAKEEDSGISVDSLRNFYNFLQLNPNLKCPAISLTPDCNIYTSWRSEMGQLFSVLFLPGGDTRFVIFKPNDLHLERQIRISGAVTTDNLFKTVTPHGVWDWISE
jgi:hypothetical protein